MDNEQLYSDICTVQMVPDGRQQNVQFKWAKMAIGKMYSFGLKDIFIIFRLHQQCWAGGWPVHPYCTKCGCVGHRIACQCDGQLKIKDWKVVDFMFLCICKSHSDLLFFTGHTKRLTWQGLHPMKEFNSSREGHLDQLTGIFSWWVQRIWYFRELLVFICLGTIIWALRSGRIHSVGNTSRELTVFGLNVKVLVGSRLMIFLKVNQTLIEVSVCPRHR